MGILFISVSAGIVVLAFILIVYFRKNKTINKPADSVSHSVVEEKTGKDKGLYD
ncbi:MAG: hypothetical protein ABI366_00730 [Ginsengibacter sp.]